MDKQITCPHCKHTYDADDMMSSDNDLWEICPNEETVQEFCVSCDQEFHVRGSYQPTYEIFESDDDL